ncbi:MAG: hypothetical protein ACPIOQ_42845, partial [Promethearchaeia archaeon]
MLVASLRLHQVAVAAPGTQVAAHPKQEPMNLDCHQGAAHRCCRVTWPPAAALPRDPDASLVRLPAAHQCHPALRKCRAWLMQLVADGAFTVFPATLSCEGELAKKCFADHAWIMSRIRGRLRCRQQPPGTPVLHQAPHDMNARRASRTPARHLTVLLGTMLLSLSSQTTPQRVDAGTRTANGACSLHALRGGGGTHDVSALSPTMKEVGAFSPRVSSPVLHALVLRDLAEGNEAADTDDVRTQFRMLSCAAASVPTAVAREVLRLGSLRHLVGRLEEHDAVFREGAQIYHRLVVDAFDHASLAARQGVGLENLPAFRKELLQALELGLDSRKVHVRQAVVEAFLAAF